MKTRLHNFFHKHDNDFPCHIIVGYVIQKQNYNSSRSREQRIVRDQHVNNKEDIFKVSEKIRTTCSQHPYGIITVLLYKSPDTNRSLRFNNYEDFRSFLHNIPENIPLLLQHQHPSHKFAI